MKKNLTDQCAYLKLIQKTVFHKRNIEPCPLDLLSTDGNQFIYTAFLLNIHKTLEKLHPHYIISLDLKPLLYSLILSLLLFVACYQFRGQWVHVVRFVGNIYICNVVKEISLIRYKNNSNMLLIRCLSRLLISLGLILYLYLAQMQHVSSLCTKPGMMLCVLFLISCVSCGNYQREVGAFTCTHSYE